MSTTWTTPRDGAGTWQHTPRPDRMTLRELLVTFVVCLLILTVGMAAVAVARIGMCEQTFEDGTPAYSYCPGFTGGPR